MQNPKIETGHLITQWGEKIEKTADKSSILSEYPRPFMVRGDWQSLNGMWKYAFCDKTEAAEQSGTFFPKHFDGEILVPFSPETRLSGVGRQLKPDGALFYEKKISFCPQILERYREEYRILLHFGAVDQRCEIVVEGRKAGSHSGGRASQSFKG